jgi:hypothetical protein
MQSKAKTVEAYLASLPAERRAAMEAVREVIRRNLDVDYEEGMLYGMIGYYVPHRVFPAGYHCDPSKPLCFAGLGSQKGYMSLYLMCVYGSEAERERFEAAWKKTGKKLDMGKSCVRFKKVDDLALDVIAETVRRVPARKYVERYVKVLEGRTPVPREEIRKKAAARKAGKGSGAKKAKEAKG